MLAEYKIYNKQSGFDRDLQNHLQLPIGVLEGKSQSTGSSFQNYMFNKVSENTKDTCSSQQFYSDLVLEKKNRENYSQAYSQRCQQNIPNLDYTQYTYTQLKNREQNNFSLETCNDKAQLQYYNVPFETSQSSQQKLQQQFFQDISSNRYKKFSMQDVDMTSQPIHTNNLDWLLQRSLSKFRTYSDKPLVDQPLRTSVNRPYVSDNVSLYERGYNKLQINNNQSQILQIPRGTTYLKNLGQRNSQQNLTQQLEGRQKSFIQTQLQLSTQKTTLPSQYSYQNFKHSLEIQEGSNLCFKRNKQQQLCQKQSKQKIDKFQNAIQKRNNATQIQSEVQQYNSTKTGQPRSNKNNQKKYRDRLKQHYLQVQQTYNRVLSQVKLERGRSQALKDQQMILKRTTLFYDISLGIFGQRQRVNCNYFTYINWLFGDKDGSKLLRSFLQVSGTDQVQNITQELQRRLESHQWMIEDLTLKTLRNYYHQKTQSLNQILTLLQEPIPLTQILIQLKIELHEFQVLYVFLQNFDGALIHQFFQQDCQDMQAKPKDYAKLLENLKFSEQELLRIQSCYRIYQSRLEGMQREEFSQALMIKEDNFNIYFPFFEGFYDTLFGSQMDKYKMYEAQIRLIKSKRHENFMNQILNVDVRLIRFDLELYQSIMFTCLSHTSCARLMVQCYPFSPNLNQLILEVDSYISKKGLEQGVHDLEIKGLEDPQF